MNGAQAIDYLWREGQVPPWIDVSVVSVEDGVTLLELHCSGRYAADEDQMYYPPRRPFGLKGPALPPGWDEINPEKFDLHWRRNAQKTAGGSGVGLDDA